MGMISMARMAELAEEIYPILKPKIERERMIDTNDVRQALKQLGSQVGSDRSLNIILERICEM